MFSVHNVKNAETFSFLFHSRSLAFAKYNCFMEKLLRYIFYAPDSGCHSFDACHYAHVQNARKGRVYLYSVFV